MIGSTLPQALEPLGVTDTSGLFAPLLSELVRLLRALAPDDWLRPTIAGSWRVRDVAAHLLDGDLRKIAVYRDRHALPLDAPIDSDRDLARFVNRLNAGGVSFADRLSARLLTDLLELTGAWTAELLTTLPLHGASIFPVSWAGEAVSENWMDTGREYTERWHHQAQIRDAVGAAQLLAPEWFIPLLDMSVRSLPVSYGRIDSSVGTSVVLQVTGETTAQFSVVRDASRWTVWRGAARSPGAVVRMASDDVWRMFYNAMPESDARDRMTVNGDSTLAMPLIRARSVIV